MHCWHLLRLSLAHLPLRIWLDKEDSYEIIGVSEIQMFDEESRAKGHSCHITSEKKTSPMDIMVTHCKELIFSCRQKLRQQDWARTH